MDQEDIELVELEDSEGNPVTLKVEKYFFYNGDEYVLLSDDLDPRPEEISHYVMKVEPVDGEDDDMVDFVPVDDALSESLLEAAQTVFDPFDAQDNE